MSAVMSRPVADCYTSTDDRRVDELDAAIGRLVRQMNADSYRLLVLVREFDDRFGWKKWTFKSCAEWLAWRASISPVGGAREGANGACAAAAACDRGRVCRGAVVVQQSQSADARRARCTTKTCCSRTRSTRRSPQVEERCRQIRNVAPDSVHHARRAWECRSLTVWRDEARGTLRLTVEVPIEEGELIVRALDCAVAGGEVTTDVDPNAVAESKGTAWRAQQADALVAVAKSYLDGGDREGGATADHYQVVVHADATSLTGGTGRADLPLATLQRLLCDCSLVTVAEDANGNPLDVGRKQRTVSTPLRRALYARDRGCTFPGCHRKRYLNGHHLEHWLNGGETKPDNMTLLCTHHHGRLHEGAFRIVKEADGTLRFVTSDGRSIPRNGYRLEDFVDDDIGDTDDSPSREGFCTAVPRELERAEIREPAVVYRLGRVAVSPTVSRCTGSFS